LEPNPREKRGMSVLYRHQVLWSEINVWGPDFVLLVTSAFGCPASFALLCGWVCEENTHKCCPVIKSLVHRQNYNNMLKTILKYSSVHCSPGFRRNAVCSFQVFPICRLD
jgi:hypothetical protein